MKRSIIFSLALLTALPTTPHTLSNQLLKVADQAGIFNRAIVDILKVRQKIKEFISGKFFIKGALCPLTIVDGQGNQLSHKLNVLLKRPEAIFGGTFIVISTSHADLSHYSTPQTQATLQEYITATNKQNVLSRYERTNTNGIATGLFALHPITQEALPIIVADYILEGYDTRVTQAHFAIPAHDQKDFEFAHAHNLNIKLVINSAEQGKLSSPQYNKLTKQLVCAYPGDYDDCSVIDSDFLNGSIRAAYDIAMAHLQKNNIGSEYKQYLLYQLGNKHYSLHELQMIELTLAKENKELSQSQKELLKIIMIQAQADFLTIVEQFLVNAKDAKDLMVELIEESCALRDNKDAYLLKWAHFNTTETEKVVFKRDINTFNNFYKFGTELVDFLGDFASSLPCALETLKSVKNT